MKKLFVLLAATLIATPAFAGSCLAGVTSVPAFSTSAAAGSLGDYTLSCSNGGGVGGPSTLQLDFFAGAPVLAPGSWTLTESVFSSTYTGSLIGANDIRFTGIAYNSSLPSYSFELHGVQVNPGLNPAGFAYHENLSVSPTSVILVSGADQIVGVNATPEPSTLILLTVALSALLLLLPRHAV